MSDFYKPDSKNYLLETISVVATAGGIFLNGMNVAIEFLEEPVSWEGVAWSCVVSLGLLVTNLVSLEAWRGSVRWREESLQEYQQRIVPVLREQFDRLCKAAEDAGFLKRVEETIH